MRRCAVAFGLGLVAAWGCVVERINTDHCAYLEGDATCGARYGTELAFCERGSCSAAVDGDGCVATRPEDDACYSPCGGRLSFPDDASCLSGESTSTGEESGTSEGETTVASESSSGSGESSSTTGPMPCVSDEECTEPGAPFCGTEGECGTCSSTTDPDAACAGVDPELPLCVDDTCVACTPENPFVCDEQLLLCDGGSNACVPCTEHGQCDSGACELVVGTCFPPGMVVHVDGDPAAMPVPDFASISAAVADVSAGEHRVIVVHERDGDVSYQEAVTIDGDMVIALLAAPGEAPTLQGTAGNPGLAVEGAGTILYMDGLSVSGNTGGLGLRVNDAFAWVDRSRIVQNTGGGVLAENGAELTLQNCFVGGGNQDVDAIALDGSALDMLYTTVGGGGVLGGRARALYCLGASTADIRNSILVSADPMPELECAGAALAATSTETDVGNLNIMWFMGYAAGEFSLTPSGATTFADVAQWQTGDPITDIDGDPRPGVDGTPDYAGADVP